jgi:hypothetical protein
VLEPISIIIENNYVNNARGFKIEGRYMGNGTPSETVKILYNRAINVDSRLVKDGTKRNGGNYIGYFDTKGTEIPHMEIGWNHLHNHMGKHDIEDTVSLSSARGTAASPIKAHNNCFRGASYWRWQTHGDPNYNGGFYSGVIFMVESIGYPVLVDKAAANIEITDNYTFDGDNGFITVASATHVKVRRNTIVSKGKADKEDLIEGYYVHGGEFKGNTGVTTFNDEYYYMQNADGVEFDSNRRAVAQDWSVSENKNTSQPSGRVENHYPGSITPKTSTQVFETNPIYLEQGVPLTEEIVNKYEAEWWSKTLQNNLTIGPTN